MAGRPFLAHVVATARALGPAAVYVVYGHGASRARHNGGRETRWVLQAEQLGTGHAVVQATPLVPDGHLCWCFTAMCR